MRIVTSTDLEEIAKKGAESLHPQRTKIMVGMASCGIASGAKVVFNALSEEVEKLKLDAVITKTGCIGSCYKEPLVDVLQNGWPRITYENMNAEKAKELVRIVSEHGIKNEWVLAKIEEEEYVINNEVFRYSGNGAPKEIEIIPSYRDLDFFKKQQKIVMRNCGFIDPGSIEEYIARGGYLALHKVLTEMKPEEVIEEITQSGLRGRGGAGFPTGVKWKFARNAKGDTKYVICNADEGDPGAYMDRSVLEGDPHSIIEGMIIGAYAIGAGTGYIYVRAEYPLAVETLRLAIQEAKDYCLLGTNILDSGFDFTIELFIGAGAFVCGEETALISSIEGKMGEPRARPPFPAQSGLRESPTNINNVETWANIPVIITRGADWYSRIGTKKCKGTKVFSLVGKVKNTGLIEVPMGMTLREIIYEVGGGIADDKEFKAVQTGGPSGGCIPIDLIDLPVDYEELAKAGAIMGSGGMVVMDESTCMVDIAKFFLTFTADESCGKCTPCRLGTQVMKNILDNITNGKGQQGDIELLEEMGKKIKKLSLCGLGQTAPNPVLTTISYFRDEYEAHIKEKECPSITCKALVPAPCQDACPVGVDVPSYVALIALGRFKEAIDLIREDNPFPGICGRVCNHPCEYNCKMGEVDKPISICSLKRFVADYEHKLGRELSAPVKRTKKEKVAIIGSGPAGLTAAYGLVRLGYEVTVFEKLPVAGGMLSVGIPEYRLPRKIVKAEIEAITALGVEIRTNMPIGKDLTIDDLKQQGYKVIFISIGAHKGFKLGLAGEDGLQNVIDSITFLRNTNLGKREKPGDKVVVIGDDSVAIDSARVCLRLGCEEVHIVYARSKELMPVSPPEIEGAESEGVKIQYLTAATKILGKAGKVVGIECVRTELGEPDPRERRQPSLIKDSQFVIDADAIICARGQEPDLSFLEPGHGFEISEWNLFVVDSDTLQTNILGVFAGGDAVTGSATVIEAIAAGRRAANSIDNWLRGEKFFKPYKVCKPRMRVEAIELPEEFEGITRPKMPSLPVEKRIHNFKEVEIGFTEEVAICEAKRCSRCDLEE